MVLLFDLEFNWKMPPFFPSGENLRGSISQASCLLQCKGKDKMLLSQLRNRCKNYLRSCAFKNILRYVFEIQSVVIYLFTVTQSISHEKFSCAPPSFSLLLLPLILAFPQRKKFSFTKELNLRQPEIFCQPAMTRREPLSQL